ncbi:radical SAM protein [Heyndrickxia sporothermodurans]|uniref:radical SAM protein n=1 Tax=Heyndrickxia sporothermodurans TaxID=46224 RepID=UPI00362C7909
MPTEDCNFRCVYCFEHFKRGSMEVEIQDVIVNFIKKMLSKGLYTSLHINWFGGEPLHAFEVVELLSIKLIKLSQEMDVDYSSSITTNGYYLNKENFKKLIDLNITYYTITLDGLAEDHDKTRILANGCGTFNEISENLKNMTKTNYEFFVQIRNNYTLDSLNKLDGFLEYLKNNICKDYRFENVDIRPIFDNGGYNAGNFDDCVSSKKISKYKGLEKAHEYGLHNLSLKNYIRPGGIVCNASKPNYWLFGADGKIMRCNVELDTEERNIVGQIKDANNYVIDFTKLSLWIDAGKKDKVCKSCFFAPSCQGAYCASLRFNNERLNINKQPCPEEKKALSDLLGILFKEMMN